MFYKAFVWIILTAGAVFGGSYLANAQAQVPVPDPDQIRSLVATAKSLQASRPIYQEILTVTPSEALSPTETLPPTFTPTEVLSPTETVTVTPLPTRPNMEIKCARFQERDHPLAERIAKELGVRLEDIIQQFCAGRGFGEIELAYSIAAKSGIPVTEVFAKRDTGKGWGEIIQEQGLRGNPRNNPQDNPKDEQTQHPGRRPGRGRK